MREFSATTDPSMADAAPGSQRTSPIGLVRLDPAVTRLEQGLDGDLHLILPDCCHLGVRLSRTFPLSRPDAWLIVHGRDGREIGLLPSLGDLDPDSRMLAEQALRRRYFTPLVTAIVDLRDESDGGRTGGVVWDLETDRGPAILHMPNTNDHVQHLGAGRLLLTDRLGNRYEIPDIRLLDGASRSRLGRYIWL